MGTVVIWILGIIISLATVSPKSDALDIELDSEDYDSVGGLIIEKLERLPKDQETIVLDNAAAWGRVSHGDCVQ